MTTRLLGLAYDNAVKHSRRAGTTAWTSSTAAGKTCLAYKGNIDKPCTWRQWIMAVTNSQHTQFMTNSQHTVCMTNSPDCVLDWRTCKGLQREVEEQHNCLSLGRLNTWVRALQPGRCLRYCRKYRWAYCMRGRRMWNPLCSPGRNFHCRWLICTVSTYKKTLVSIMRKLESLAWQRFQ